MPNPVITATPKPAAAQKPKNPVEAIQILWEKDKKFVIQQAIIILSLIVLVFVVFIPLFSKIHTLNEKTRELDRQIATAKTKIKKIPESKQQMELYGKEIESVEKRFFQIRDLDQLLGNLSKLAANDGVVIVGSKPINDKQQALPDQYNKKYFPVSYELTLIGDYHDFGKFINDVEQSEKLVLVHELAIQQSTARQARKLQCSFEVTAFVRAPQGIQ